MTPPRLAPKLQSLPPMLHIVRPDPMSSCSKAARGLFVLLRTDGIFTVNALSPSSSLRQYPYHCAIRAGRNLPDKEFRYLRTVIVTAAVHRGFSSKREPLSLTFRHRAGVSPYTSTFVFAETCVFGKQSPGLFCCGLHCWRRTLSRSYGRFCCRIPLGTFSRKPWSTRPEHLCWFAVRAAIPTRMKAFPVSLAHTT